VARFARRWQVLIASVAIGAALAIAEARGGASADRVASAFVIVVAFGAVVAGLQRRSETAGVLAGNPVDERWQLVNDRATSLTALMGTAVSLGGFVVAELARVESWQFGLTAAAMGGAYIGGVFWYRSRT
jgi:hypothetical protein